MGLTLIACETPEQPEEPTLSAPERPEAPAPAPAKSRQDFDEVYYTIARGGTLRNVANLYKLHHHEIIELNPRLDPDAQLEPSTRVLVYDNPREQSESVGLPHAGKQVGAMPMPDGPGRKITAERWKTWGTRHSVRSLDKVLRKWHDAHPSGPLVLVGNLSSRRGGPLSPHKTHQSGRDVDVSYIAHWDGKSRVTWQHMSKANLDAEKTWQLLKLFDKHSNVEAFFIDKSLQQVLLDHARKHGTIRKGRLPHWLEVAGVEGANITPKIRHVPGHRDHIHVRFACPSNQSRCE